MPRARPCRRLRLSCTAGGTVTPGKTTGCSRQRSKALLTIFHGLRRTECEEPNSSCDDRCNAPIIRRECSALLFFAGFHSAWVPSEIRRLLKLRHVRSGGICCRALTSGNPLLAAQLLPVGRSP